MKDIIIIDDPCSKPDSPDAIEERRKAIQWFRDELERRGVSFPAAYQSRVCPDA